MDFFFELEGVSSALVAVIAVSVFAGAFAQALTGLGFVLVCGPAFVSGLGAQRGVAAAVLMAVLANLAPLAHERRDVHLGRAALLFLPAAIATPVLALTLDDLDSDIAMALAGAAILAGTALLAGGFRSSRAHGPAGVAGAGAASAAMNYLGGVGGPVAALYGMNAGWPAKELRATLQAYLLALNCVTVAVLGLVGLPLVMYVALLCGTVVGVLAVGRISERAARNATLIVSALGGLIVLARAFA